jgi:hypothetical protein
VHRLQASSAIATIARKAPARSKHSRMQVPFEIPMEGTAYLLYRKDRVDCLRGAQLLQGYKVREKSVTNRVVATCCNSAMFLNFEKGHWLSVYRARFRGDVPPLQMRIQTKFKPENSNVPNDVPSYSTFPLMFVAKLVAARIAMLLRV